MRLRLRHATLHAESLTQLTEFHNPDTFRLQYREHILPCLLQLGVARCGRIGQQPRRIRILVSHACTLTLTARHNHQVTRDRKLAAVKPDGWRGLLLLLMQHKTHACTEGNWTMDCAVEFESELAEKRLENILHNEVAKLTGASERTRTASLHLTLHW